MIFEGEETEKIIFDSLKQYFLNENTNTIIYGFHCGEIYSLYHKLKNDTDLEIFPLLKEKLKIKNTVLQNINRDEVSEIYLFFDYDGHAPSADDDKLKEMITLFNNETENGKLYISYPMAEAIQHIKEDIEFKNTLAKSSKEATGLSKSYKNIALNSCDNCYTDLNHLSNDNWKVIIDEHCKKLNFIMINDFTFPSQLFEQLNLLNKQVDIKEQNNNKVSVLSSFPIMLIDYYGYSKLKEKITTH